MGNRMCPYYDNSKIVNCATITRRTRHKWCARSNGECQIITPKKKMVVRKINRKIGGTNTYEKWVADKTRIHLSNGYVVFISSQDTEACMKYIWFCQSVGGKGAYAATRINGKRTLMHRYLLSVKQGEIIDHKDGNGLNNTRGNLRICSETQNHQNAKKRCGCSSQYKGVSWHKGESKWHARITVNGNRISLGYFIHEHLAAEAYNWAAIKYFGEFAKPNTILIEAKWLKGEK